MNTKNKVRNFIYHSKEYWFAHTFLRPVFRRFRDSGYKDIVCAEIGIADGYNLDSLLYNLDIKKIYAIDINTDQCKTRDNCIQFIKGDSLKMYKMIPDNSLDFCYLDSNHSYEHVVKEIPLYLDKVKNGGILCGHDWNHHGVAKAVLEHFDIDDIDFLGTDWIYKLG